MPIKNVTIDDVRRAESVLAPHTSPAPLIRSIALEQELQLPANRRVWLKDYGWTASGSFKLMGALNWMHNNLHLLESRPVAAHSSGNFASGIAYAGMRFGKRVIVVMPEQAPKIKFERTKSFGAEIRTYDAVRDHITGDRERLAKEVVEQENGLLASPYDDPYVIAGNGVGALDTVRDLKRYGRELSHFFCAVSGGGLMSGQAIAIHDGFPNATIIGVEPAEAADLSQSFASGNRERIAHPKSICDGLLSYSVGEHNWPILREHLKHVVTIPDDDTKWAMKFLYTKHGLRVEPSGAITTAALLKREVDLGSQGDIVLVVSGRNVDDDRFQNWINEV